MRLHEELHGLCEAVENAVLRDYICKTNRKFTSAGEKLLQFTPGAGKTLIELIAVSEII